MKKHVFIWVFGILSSLAAWIAQGVGTMYPQDATSPLWWYALALVLELFMAYGVWLMIQEKHRSKWFLILPIFGGFIGALIMYLIPKKKEGDSVIQPSISS